MKTILVHIGGNDGEAARLQAAFDLARAFGGHVQCLQVTPYAAYTVGDGIGTFPLAALMEAIEAERSARRTAVEVRLRAEGVAWDWVDVDGDPAERLSEAARLADVVVMNAGPFARAAGLRLGLVADVAIRAPAPVVAVPVGSAGFAVTGGAIVAWDGSQEAAVAMRAALPMLRLAEAVDVLTVAEKASEYPARAAATWLARHGVRAEVIERADGGLTVEAVIREVVKERRAAWLVQGAYGHSRLRQMIFGGVTRGLLADAPVPLVLGH